MMHQRPSLPLSLSLSLRRTLSRNYARSLNLSQLQGQKQNPSGLPQRLAVKPTTGHKPGASRSRKLFEMRLSSMIRA